MPYGKSMFRWEQNCSAWLPVSFVEGAQIGFLLGWVPEVRGLTDFWFRLASAVPSVLLVAVSAAVRGLLGQLLPILLIFIVLKIFVFQNAQEGPEPHHHFCGDELVVIQCELRRM